MYENDDNFIQERIKHIKSLPKGDDSIIPDRFFNATPNCNLHKYKLTMNHPRLCDRQDTVDLLIMIRTVPGQLDRRMAIRETWGSNKNFPNIRMVVVFLIGMTKTEEEQQQIDAEDGVYGDILQENFAESYHNLHLKTVMAWKWATLNCPNACNVMVANDELIVDVYKLIPHLNAQSKVEQNNFTLCVPSFRARVFRDHEKFGISKEIYAPNFWPTFCVGVGYMAPYSVIRNLYFMSRDTPMFMPDDTWVGILAEKLGLGFTDNRPEFQLTRFKAKVKSATYIESRTFFGVLDEDHDRSMVGYHITKTWNLILKQHRLHRNRTDDIDSSSLTCYKDNWSSSHFHNTLNNTWLSLLHRYIIFIQIATLSLFGWSIFC